MVLREAGSALPGRAWVQVVDGGTMGSRRHLNIRGKSANLPAITERDWKDIDFGIRMGVDFYALSFVRDAACIYELQAYLKRHGSSAQVCLCHRRHPLCRAGWPPPATPQSLEPLEAHHSPARQFLQAIRRRPLAPPGLTFCEADLLVLMPTGMCMPSNALDDLLDEAAHRLRAPLLHGQGVVQADTAGGFCQRRHPSPPATSAPTSDPLRSAAVGAGQDRVC